MGRVLSPLLANIALSVLDRRFEAAWQAHDGPSACATPGEGPAHLPARPLRGRLPGAGARHPSPSRGAQAADGRVHGRADAIDALAREDSTSPTSTTASTSSGWRVKRRPRPGTSAVAYTFPSDRALGEIKHRIKTLTGRATHEPLARRADPRAQPDPPGLDQLPPPQRGEALLRIPQLLPVVASDPLATQEVPAADLETDQATMLGTQLDQPRRHKARLARRGTSDPLPLSRPPHPIAVGGTPNQDATTRRRATTNA